MLASFFVELKLNMQTCFIHYEYFHLIPLYTSVDYRKIGLHFYMENLRYTNAT